MLVKPSSPAPALCLACSSSLPPRKDLSDGNIFLTPCCTRPICPNCLTSNPRLARYNPCLRCLGGVGVVQTRSGARPSSWTSGGDATGTEDNQAQNIDGGVHDGDVYVLGDDDDDDDDEEEEDEPTEALEDQDPYSVLQVNASSDIPVSVDGRHSIEPSDIASSVPGSDATTPAEQKDQPQAQPSNGTPPKYYIQSGDTLHSISLKYRINPQLICRLNNLPLSTLRSTPHLLHTRTYLTLPASSRTPPPEDPAVEAERVARRQREIAQSRLQSITGEVDWRIAKTYVALAEHHLDDAEVEVGAGFEKYEKEYEEGKGRVRVKESKAGRFGGAKLDERAVDSYLDDDEWEHRERREGRDVSIPKFPLFESGSSSIGNSTVWTIPPWMKWKV